MGLGRGCARGHRLGDGVARDGVSVRATLDDVDRDRRRLPGGVVHRDGGDHRRVALSSAYNGAMFGRRFPAAARIVRAVAGLVGAGALVVALAPRAARADREAEDAARVDWAAGRITAGGTGLADRHAPSPAVAPGTSRR